jgi:hypothetical protein
MFQLVVGSNTNILYPDICQKNNHLCKINTKYVKRNLNLYKPSIWEALLTVKKQYMIYLNTALLKYKTLNQYTAKYQYETGLKFGAKSQ